MGRDERLKLAFPNGRDYMYQPCYKCGTRTDVKRYRRILRDGHWQVFDYCHFCNWRSDFIPLDMVSNFKELPIFNEELLIRPRQVKCCVVCGSLNEVHMHHWAPIKLFGDEAAIWPISFLCADCHRKWHNIINAFDAEAGETS